jgi:hypothetical protein
LGTWETASWFLGVPAGKNFEIKAGEAYLIYMKQAMNAVWFEGIAQGASVDLMPGLNMVNLPSAEPVLVYSSYDMLEDLVESQVSSIRRFDDSIDLWKTTSWFLGAPAGEDFITSRGEGYLLYMREALEDWRAY